MIPVRPWASVSWISPASRRLASASSAIIWPRSAFWSRARVVIRAVLNTSATSTAAISP
jgi:hypothetical protein